MTAATNAFGDGVVATGFGSSATIGPFYVLGGKYGLSVVCGGTVSIQLNQLGADGSTYVAVGSAVSAQGLTSVDLPPGTYEITTGSSSSGVNVSLIRIPYRAA